MTQNIGFVILSAGQGTRLGCTDMPKVMLPIGGRPIVSYTVEMLERAGAPKDRIVLVLGFQKEKVEAHFGGRVSYAVQDEQLGTAHAAYAGMKSLPSYVSTVCIMGGDDSAFYSAETLAHFAGMHALAGAALSVLTAQVENPEGLGRIIRDRQGGFTDILEKEELNDEQQKITEVNTGTYYVERSWFEEFFPSFEKIPGLGEYGMNEAITAAREQGKIIQAVPMKNPREWFGVNTPEELDEADRRKMV